MMMLHVEVRGKKSAKAPWLTHDRRKMTAANYEKYVSVVAKNFATCPEATVLFIAWELDPAEAASDAIPTQPDLI